MEKTPTTKTENTCQYCKKILHGRSDQRFCNDHCRNTFNRIKRKAAKIADHEHMPQIIAIIKKNYEILKSHSRQPLIAETLSLPTKTLTAEGLNPKFFTSSFIDHQGTAWRCIFERCFILGDEQSFIQDFPVQAELD